MAIRQKFPKLDRAWRKIATGYCFVLFGVCAIILSATLFPLLRLISRDAEAGRVRIQEAMRFVMAVFIGMMRVVGVISYELHGLERLNLVGRERGTLIVANHPSLIDVVFLVSLMREVDCIVKEALWRNPFLRWPVLWAGYIPNRSAEELVESCARNLHAGRSLLVFPEGTRTVPGQPLTMRRGAAQIALASRADILPITISCEPLMLAKTQAWHQAPHGPGHFVISVGEPIPASVYAPVGVAHSLAARAITRRMEEYFASSLKVLAGATPVATVQPALGSDPLGLTEDPSELEDAELSSP
ncbi:MAG TPA: lysophospholipid acyltransferase family protein [Steroidobacteraceae bacterium]|nr:lysophospholipid acyltransferase family protein [Steroidobacteraceae bacterium]